MKRITFDDIKGKDLDVQIGNTLISIRDLFFQIALNTESQKLDDIEEKDLDVQIGNTLISIRDLGEGCAMLILKPLSKAEEL